MCWYLLCHYYINLIPLTIQIIHTHLNHNFYLGKIYFPEGTHHWNEEWSFSRSTFFLVISLPVKNGYLIFSSEFYKYLLSAIVYSLSQLFIRSSLMGVFALNSVMVHNNMALAFSQGCCDSPRWELALEVSGQSCSVATHAGS